jgi:hypothetical protein
MEQEQMEAKLMEVWHSISPPVPEVELINNWYGVIYKGKRRKMLYVAKFIRRFLDDDGGPIDSIEMRCLMPKNGSGDILEDTPDHLPDDIGQFKMMDVIAGPLTVTPVPPQKFVVKGYDRLVVFFDKVKDLEFK